MRPHRARLGVLLAVVTLAVPAAPARADSVTDWSANASTALMGTAGQGATAIAHMAMVHGAIFDAVNAIDHRYEAYLGAPPAKRWYSKDAAVAAAAHRVLVSGRVVAAGQQAALETSVDQLYAAALAAIPDGPAKAGGIATGEAAGWAMVAARTDDGRFGPYRFPVGTRPGEWRPVLPAFVNDPGAWLKDVDPFLVRRPGRFATRGPNALTSRAYTREYAEVKAIGKSDSATRTADQTAAARFWGAANAVATWAMLDRTLAGLRPMDTVDRARFYALIWLTSADAAIAVWIDKAKWLYWRPITAIQEGDADGNPETVGDPAWLPLINNPPYPEHASGLTALAASHVASLRELFGTDRVTFGGTITPAMGAPVTRSYTRLSQAVDETVDARVWSGIHFRIADVQGAKLGREVAEWRREHRFLRPLRHR